MCRHGATVWHFPAHVRSFLDQLTLRQTAAWRAAAGAVIGNDSGLFHMAAAIGTPTVRLFGPTSHLSLGQFSPNVQVLRAGLACEPCWFGALPSLRRPDTMSAAA